MKKLLFDLDVNVSAAHVVNPTEFFSKALLSTPSTALFRPFVNVNSKMKLGSLEFQDVIQEAGCDFTSTDADLAAKAMEPEKLAIGVQLCQYDLQNSFVAEYMRNGNVIDFANTSGLTPEFMAHYYERLGAKLVDNLERLTWKGNKLGATATYLDYADGLETQLAADVAVIDIPGIAITTANVLAELTKVYNAIPVELAKEKVTILVSSNVAAAYRIVVSQGNTISYITKNLEFSFLDVKMVECKGMSNNTIVATDVAANLIFMTDLVSPASELITINMKETTGDRKLRTIADFTWGVNYVNPSEIVFYSPLVS